ncbi:MAG: YncE family protein, partial [Planctomycetota bacterium]
MPKAYVTNTDSDDISVVDLDLLKEVDRISIGGSPRGAVKFDSQKN